MGFNPADLYTSSIKSEEVESLEPVIHGTFSSCWNNNIKETGLVPGGLNSKGSRLAVHFLAVGSAVKKTGGTAVSALRETADFFIFFNLKQWLADGHEAYLTTNCVVNVHEVVSPEYFYTTCRKRARTWRNEDWLSYWETEQKPFGGNPPPAPGRYNPADAEEPVPTTPLPETPPASPVGEPAYAGGGALDVSPYTGVFDAYGDEIPCVRPWQTLSREQQRVVLLALPDAANADGSSNLYNNTEEAAGLAITAVIWQ